MPLITLSDFTRSNIIASAIVVEAGYTNNPADRGGPTKYGITQAVAMRYKDQLVAKFGWDGDMRNLTEDMAVYIYIPEYWNKMSLDGIFAISPVFADMVFEAGINVGVGTVCQWVQTIVNVMNNNQAYYPDLKVDGNVGPVTLKALQTLLKVRPRDGLPNVLFMFSAMASSRYVDICSRYPDQEIFMSGWANRARNKYNDLLPILKSMGFQ